jgi:hypothetical protein
MSVHQIIYEGEDDYYEEEEDHYEEDFGVDDYDSGIENVHEYYERWFRQSLRILNNMGNAILQLQQQQQVRAPPLMHQRTLTDIDNEYVRASEQLRNASDAHEVAYWNARRIELAAEAESQRVAAAPPPPDAAAAAAAAAEHAEIESGLVHDLEDARDRRRHDRRRRRDPWYDLREENLSR